MENGVRGTDTVGTKVQMGTSIAYHKYAEAEEEQKIDLAEAQTSHGKGTQNTGK